jgi:hypothetical protein
MNGKDILTTTSLTKPQFDESQQGCIDVFTDALEEAMKGRITSCAIVACMDDGIATVMAGKNGGALNIGCDDLKMKIHAAMFEDRNTVAARRKPSNILRVK